MDDREEFDCFVASIFYVGKGSRNRPYYHLYEAIKKQKSNTQVRNIENKEVIYM